jgi:DnaJ-class molecular chaperone
MEWREVKKSYRDRLDELAHLRPAQLLEVPDDAPREEIRKAYLAKVRTYHPDAVDPFVKAYSEEVLKLVNRAYEVLTREGNRG